MDILGCKIKQQKAYAKKVRIIFKKETQPYRSKVAQEGGKETYFACAFTEKESSTSS